MQTWIKIEYLLMISIFAILVFTSISAAQSFPIKVKVIDKDQAEYDTPENAYISSYSADVKEDLDWKLETMTVEAVDELKSSFKGREPMAETMLKHEKASRETYIVNKVFYNDAYVLTVEHYYEDGSIQRTPVTFVLENEKWKLTDKFSNDKNVNQYSVYHKRASVVRQAVPTYSRIRFDSETRRFSSDMVIFNQSGKELRGPVWLKIKILQPSDATLENADGTHFNEPYLVLLDEDSIWPAGKSLPIKTLFFTNPAGQKITFEDEVFAVVPEEDS